MQKLEQEFISNHPCLLRILTGWYNCNELNRLGLNF
jgi:hypothetical protein